MIPSTTGSNWSRAIENAVISDIPDSPESVRLAISKLMPLEFARVPAAAVSNHEFNASVVAGVISCTPNWDITGNKLTYRRRSSDIVLLLIKQEGGRAWETTTAKA
jgi:hypothetical protein